MAARTIISRLSRPTGTSNTGKVRKTARTRSSRWGCSPMGRGSPWLFLFSTIWENGPSSSPSPLRSCPKRAGNGLWTPKVLNVSRMTSLWTEISPMRRMPAFVRMENRITAHFLICFLVLLVYRLLEERLGGAYTCEDKFSFYL